MSKLYTLIQVHKLTGEHRIVYGHVTANVIADFWEANVDDTHSVLVTEYTPSKFVVVK